MSAGIFAVACLVFCASFLLGCASCYRAFVSLRALRLPLFGAVAGTALCVLMAVCVILAGVWLGLALAVAWGVL